VSEIGRSRKASPSPTKPPYFIPCRRSSPDQPDGQARDGHPQVVITILTISFYPQINKFRLIVPHGRMARGDYGHPKVSTGPAMPDPSTPFGEVNPETALQPFQGWPTHKAGGLRPSSSPLDTPRRTPMLRPDECRRRIVPPSQTPSRAFQVGFTILNLTCFNCAVLCFAMF
jgi:hypothetical protein